MRKPFYSIGIIFKNEIRCLERCLTSLKPLREAVPCEVVMADTGSTDGSRKLAEKYADILFDFPWVDDFAAARNAVIDRCSGVWYMSVDADEWFSGDAAELVLFSKQKKLPRDIAGFTIRNCKSEYGAASDHYMEFTALRMMRLASGLRYEGCIHEKFNVEAPDVMMLGNTLFYHDGYYGSDEFMETKRRRNLRLLDKKIKDRPDDLETLTECIDSMKTADPDVVPPEKIMDYTRHSLKLLHGDWKRWEKSGPTVYRNAVSVAKLLKQPEVIEWAEKAVELFPDSLFTRIDVAYYAFGCSWDENRLADAVRWGEMYLAGIADYRAGRFDCVEVMRGLLEMASPHWERQLLIVMAQAKMELGEPEKTRDILAGLDGSAMDQASQVEGYVNIMMRLHRTMDLDMLPLAARFWEQVNRPVPDEKMAETRRDAFLKTASASFELSYLADELTKKDFQRHSYTLFLALGEDCRLHAFAAMLEEDGPEVLTETLTRWDGAPVPVSVLYHALECGMPFPLPGKPQKAEHMDMLANALAREPVRLIRLVLGGFSAENALQTYWTGALTLAAVESCPWKDEEQGAALARCFAKRERQFLSVYYAPELLTEENILLLPPVHRFGWLFARAYEALDSGDTAAYVWLLREGLSVCGSMKPMVEFLLEHTPQLQAPRPPEELLVLAKQVRAILAAYPANDPAVAALKRSPAYQKVAYLLEGQEIAGGVEQ